MVDLQTRDAVAESWEAATASGAPWQVLCPDWTAAATDTYRVLWNAVDPGLLDLSRQRMAMILGAERPSAPGGLDSEHAEKSAELALWPTSPRFDDTERAVIAFTEQFVMDVGSMDDSTRDAFTHALGDQAMTFAQAMYLVDLGLRIDMVMPHLFGVPGPVLPVAPQSPGSDTGTELWPAVTPLSAAAGRMHLIDPLTVELARLRLARTHQCRICSSRRNLSALDVVNGDASIFDKIDFYEQSDMTERHKTALRLTDVLLTGPATLDHTLIAQVREQFTPVEAIELLVRNFRNAVNKFAVALATDEAKVAEGTELFDVDPTGTVVASTDETLLRRLVAGSPA